MALSQLKRGREIGRGKGRKDIDYLLGSWHTRVIIDYKGRSSAGGDLVGS